MGPRLVIITNGNYFAHLILSKTFERHVESIAGILIVTGDYKGHTGFRALWGLSKPTGTPYLVYKLLSYAWFVLAQRVFPDVSLSVKQQARHIGVPIFESLSVNSGTARSWVASLGPDLLVSVSCPQLIGRTMLMLPRQGGINIHSSLLPTYAGLAPYFWVLSRGERETGTTVHYMTSRFDAGNILVQKQMTIQPGESAFHLFKRLARLGSEALDEAILLALRSEPGIKQDLGQYTYYSHPSFKSYLDLRKRGHVLMRISELIETIKEEIGQHAA